MRVPVCLRYGEDGRVHESCHLIGEREQKMVKALEDELQASEFFGAPRQKLQNMHQRLELRKAAFEATPLAEENLRELGIVTHFLHQPRLSAPALSAHGEHRGKSGRAPSPVSNEIAHPVVIGLSPHEAAREDVTLSGFNRFHFV